MEEVWKPLTRFIKPKYYYYEIDNKPTPLFEVSNLWRIRSYRYNTPKIITNIHPNTSWYLIYQFKYKWKRVSLLVHRMVMEGFYWPPKDWLQVNHKNWIKTDNRLENLEYITHQENINQAIKWESHHFYNKTWQNHPRSKLVLQKWRDNKVIKEWESANLAAKHFNWNRSHISRAINKGMSAYWYLWSFK